MPGSYPPFPANRRHRRLPLVYFLIRYSAGGRNSAARHRAASASRLCRAALTLITCAIITFVAAAGLPLLRRRGARVSGVRNRRSPAHPRPAKRNRHSLPRPRALHAPPPPRPRLQILARRVSRRDDLQYPAAGEDSGGASVRLVSRQGTRPAGSENPRRRFAEMGAAFDGVPAYQVQGAQLPLPRVPPQGVRVHARRVGARQGQQPRHARRHARGRGPGRGRGRR
ncbi:unnamed protein product [Closterium sp. NIES-54]